MNIDIGLLLAILTVSAGIWAICLQIKSEQRWRSPGHIGLLVLLVTCAFLTVFEYRQNELKSQEAKFQLAKHDFTLEVEAIATGIIDRERYLENSPPSLTVSLYDNSSKAKWEFLLKPLDGFVEGGGYSRGVLTQKRIYLTESIKYEPGSLEYLWDIDGAEIQNSRGPYFAFPDINVKGESTKWKLNTSLYIQDREYTSTDSKRLTFEIDGLSKDQLMQE